MDYSEEDDLEIFKGMSFYCDGRLSVNKREFMNNIKTFGGTVTTKPQTCTHYISTPDTLEQISEETKKRLLAQNIFFVSELFVIDSIARKSAQKERRYILLSKSSQKVDDKPESKRQKRKVIQYESSDDDEPMEHERPPQKTYAKASGPQIGLDELLSLASPTENHDELFTREQVAKWSLSDMNKWLRKKLTLDDEEINTLSNWLVKEKIDGSTLPYITMEHLTDTRLTFGTRVKLTRLIKNHIF
jgi:hypothetical protein